MEACRASWQQDITWGVGKRQVAGDHGHDCSLNAAAVERVRLDHKHRPPKSGFGATRCGQIGPPDFSPLNLVHFYQESFPRDLSWERCNAGSTLAGWREYTSFRRSVMALPCCRLRNSESAVAYNRLLDTRRRRAAASAIRKTSSGTETAVFMIIV